MSLNTFLFCRVKNDKTVCNTLRENDKQFSPVNAKNQIVA